MQQHLTCLFALSPQATTCEEVNITMAAAQDWLLQIHTDVQSMRQTIDSIPNNNTLPTHEHWLDQLSTLQQKLHRHLAIGINISADTSTQHQYTLFVTAFTAFLSAVVPRLDRLSVRLAEAENAGTKADGEIVFAVLWDCLVRSSEAYETISDKWRSLWPRNQKQFSIPLYTAFQALLQWLLSLSRNPAWLSSKRAHTRPVRHHGFRTVLAQPISTLGDYSCSTQSNFLAHLHLLPPSFVPLICCIMSEQLGNAPPLVPRAHQAVSSNTESASHLTDLSSFSFPLASSMSSVRQLVVVINNLCVHALQYTSGSGQFPFLLEPAVSHFLKMVILLPIKPLLLQPGVIRCSLQSLCDFLRVSLNYAETHPSKPLSRSDRDANISAFGLPLHTNPHLSSVALETDVRLLHALGLFMGQGIDLLTCFQLQLYVLEGWRVGTILYLASKPALQVMAASMVGLAKQCSLHGLLLMRLLQTGQPRQDNKQSELKPTQTKNHQPEQQLLATLNENIRMEQLLFEGEHMQQIRRLMFRTSNFLNLVKNDQLNKTGESTE